MTTQEELQTGIGTEEAIQLKPKAVLIKEVNIEEVGQKKAKKVVCSVQHPDSNDLIKISSVKYENKVKGRLEISGLWRNLDSQNLIRKGSALAILMNALGANTIGELAMKSCETVADEKGYLVFKAF